MSEEILLRREQPSDAAAIDALQRAAFGPGAYARAAFRVREQAPHELALSSVIERRGSLIGSVRLTPIRIGARAGLLLGPVVVDPCCKGQGFGKRLVREAVAAAKGAGCGFVVLVGDAPYYGPLGFRAPPPGKVTMPGPVDPARLLIAELKPGAAAEISGAVEGYSPFADAGAELAAAE